MMPIMLKIITVPNSVKEMLTTSTPAIMVMPDLIIRDTIHLIIQDTILLIIQGIIIMAGPIMIHSGILTTLLAGEFILV